MLRVKYLVISLFFLITACRGKEQASENKEKVYMPIDAVRREKVNTDSFVSKEPALKGKVHDMRTTVQDTNAEKGKVPEWGTEAWVKWAEEGNAFKFVHAKATAITDSTSGKNNITVSLNNSATYTTYNIECFTIGFYSKRHIMLADTQININVTLPPGTRKKEIRLSDIRIPDNTSTISAYSFNLCRR